MPWPSTWPEPNGGEFRPLRLSVAEGGSGSLGVRGRRSSGSSWDRSGDHRLGGRGLQPAFGRELQPSLARTTASRMSRPCRRYLRNTLASTACVSAPSSVQPPADSFRVITDGRPSRSVRLFVASTPSWSRNRKCRPQRRPPKRGKTAGSDPTENGQEKTKKT
jgi:hypothetical protein